MAAPHLFQPGVSMTLTVTEASARVMLPVRGGSIRICNPSDHTVWIRFGDGAVVADTANSILMNPASVIQWRVPRNATALAAVCEPQIPAKSTPIKLNITHGEGS